VDLATTEKAAVAGRLFKRGHDKTPYAPWDTRNSFEKLFVVLKNDNALRWYSTTAVSNNYEGFIDLS